MEVVIVVVVRSGSSTSGIDNTGGSSSSNIDRIQVYFQGFYHCIYVIFCREVPTRSL